MGLMTTTEQGRGQSRQVWALALAVIIVGAFAIRMVDLGGRSLWVDEGATWVLSQRTLPEIIENSGDDEHPSGYYALIHLTSRISDSEAALRLPSVIASVLAILATYLLGRDLVNHRLGLTAAALLALSPLDVWYAQEARQPIFAALIVVSAGYALSRGRWWGVIAASALLIIGLYLDFITAVGWVAFGGIWITIWFRKDRERVVDWASVTVVAVLIYAPLQGSEFFKGFSGLLGYQGGGFWYGEILGSNPVTSSPFGLLLLGGLVTAGVFALGRAITRPTRSGRLLSVLIVSGFALGSALMAVPRAYSVKKVIVTGWPVLTLLVAYLLVERVTGRSQRLLMGGAIALLALGTIATFTVPKDDWRNATAFVNENAADGDVVWVGPDPWAADAYFYYGGELPVFHETSPDQRSIPGDVWLMTYRRPQDTPPSLEVEAWFDANWTLAGPEEPFYRMAVRHYVTP